MSLNKKFLTQAGLFLVFVLGFWAVSAIYLSPAIGGEKVLRQGDMQQTRLMRAELDSFKELHGEYPGWSDGLFSGMPTSLISGIPNGNLVYQTGIVQLFNLVNTPFNFLFVAMISMFVLLIAAGVNRWLAAAGALGYAFMTFSITSYEAGHITKVLAMGAMPGMLAGLVYLNRKMYLAGIAVLALFFTLTVGYFHYQIAFYAGIIAAVFLLFSVVKAVLGNDIKHALIMGALGVLGLGAGVVTNLGKIIDTEQYGRATMRGGSEVASEVPKDGPKQQVAKKGLDREYAFSWSYSPTETFTLLVPRFVGGSSGESIGENDITQDDSKLPLYFGDLQFTSGPVYMGAVFIFLFILAIVSILVLSKSEPEKYSLARGIMWFAITTTAISIILAFGRFFSFNNLLFDYLPFYNKFRTPMMALAIAQVTVPFLGLYGLHLLLSSDLGKSDVLKKIFKNTLIASGVLVGLAGVVLFSSDFSAPGDAQLKDRGWPAEAVQKLKDLRSSVAWKDLFRSLVFMGLAYLLVWLVAIKKQNKALVWAGMILLILADMVGVSKRYLSDENWEDKAVEEEIIPTPKDQALMAVNKNHARVFDLRYNPFNDAHSAPWHRSIGGYHPAKLSRYQDVISYCITPNGGSLSFEGMMKNNALDMLNCAYILSVSQDQKSEEVFSRPTALGNAWFVSKVIHVPTAKAAIETINTFNPSNEAVFEDKESIKPAADSYIKDSTASIEISQYGLDTISYKVNNSNKGFAVFSEIYYNESNGSWSCFADGKEVPIIRVNYILRGADIPAGTKSVKMVYNKQVNRYLTLERGTSGLILLLLAFAVAKGAVSKETESDSPDA